MRLPNALVGIPDLEQLYEAADRQVEKLYEDLDQLDEDVFIDNMSETRVKRWETMLGLTPKETDTLQERRFAVHSRVVDKLPYSYRVILSDLKALDPDATLEIDYTNMKATVSVDLSSQSMVAAIQDLLEKKLPLNMTYTVETLYNVWRRIKPYKWGEISTLTWYQIKTKEDI